MYCLFCDVPCTVYVYMCTVLLPPGGYPIAVKYIISYQLPLHGFAQIGASTGWAKLEVWPCSVALSCYWEVLALWFMLYELPHNSSEPSECIQTDRRDHCKVCTASTVDELIRNPWSEPDKLIHAVRTASQLIRALWVHSDRQTRSLQSLHSFDGRWTNQYVIRGVNLTSWNRIIG